MTIRSEMREALPDMFNAMGEEALFIPLGESALPCHVFIEFGVNVEPDGFTAQAGQKVTVIEALLSELNGFEPGKDDAFTVEGKTYTVQRILDNDSFTVKAAVK